MRLIDADALNDKLENLKIKNIKNKYTAIEGFEEVFKVIEGYSFTQILLRDAPTIDPARLRPKGWWVMTLYTTASKRGRVISNGKFECSECGYGNGRKKSNFCPNCGADMRGDINAAD